ncbi:predicted protein [Phaeodactylum tricornutum CCAP 1055/1]|jgi:hypothetical protein|uniref:Uncharacterized protein n=2 Tax=Phaeodactylum tricornutum TaxID=2850 RepID=B7G6E6_PHATC|nr:predicted protein [Phaeodactylum tricornutum CCAP 1055/1]EEC46000.1 predicted protein [Phaeodactylum tricornutum CCAP 1055/1]|eukprot:XP_002182713.1 predicted protein [Phaeodactylum tricornutum CCAP 1055/1]
MPAILMRSLPMRRCHPSQPTKTTAASTLLADFHALSLRLSSTHTTPSSSQYSSRSATPRPSRSSSGYFQETSSPSASLWGKELATNGEDEWGQFVDFGVTR